MKAMQQQWEHRFASFSGPVFAEQVTEAQEQADTFAQQGWELVTSEVVPEIVDGSTRRYLVLLGFKRQS